MVSLSTWTRKFASAPITLKRRASRFRRYGAVHESFLSRSVSTISVPSAISDVKLIGIGLYVCSPPRSISFLIASRSIINAFRSPFLMEYTSTRRAIENTDSLPMPFRPMTCRPSGVTAPPGSFRF